MSANENTAPKRDVYERVTSQIVNAIEQGVSTWRMPWHTSGKFAFSPINVTSKKPYRGINTLCLWAAAHAKGYERGEWPPTSNGMTAAPKFARARRLPQSFSGSSPTPKHRTMAKSIPRADHGCCSHAAIQYSMPPRWTATHPGLTLIRRSNSGLNLPSSSSAASTRAWSIKETVHSTHPIPIPSPCRRLLRSSLHWTITHASP
jgi:hypothetical protein